jgi:hypothetical protein
MKACVHIVLLLFITFLSGPTIVSLLEDRNDDKVTVMISLEEEIQKEIKEIKVSPYQPFEFAYVPVQKKSALIISKNPHGHKTVSGDIFIPPPERA